MKLYVVRHGRTNCNDQKVFNGRFEEDINEEGIKQAEILKEKIRNLPIDLIVCSPMKRAISTASIINIHNIPIIVSDDFIERNVGDLTLQKIDKTDFYEYNKLYDTEYVGLETISQIMERVFKGLNTIKEKYPNKNILIVTHASVTRCIGAYFNGFNKTSYQNENALENCEIKEYDW